MPGTSVQPGQIYRDNCYYFNAQDYICMRKYILVLAVELNSSDSVTAAFTSKSNGLNEVPPCSLGPPRSGYYVGTPGGVLSMPTWVDFSNLNILDIYDLTLHINSGRTALVPLTLPLETLCGVLRCVLRSDDITQRQAKWIGDTAETLRCE